MKTKFFYLCVIYFSLRWAVGGWEIKKELVALSRNWSEYNSELVRRSEFYLSPDFLDSWFDELEEMNSGKVERPYEFPESFVQFAALWHEFFHLPYRQLEGALKKLSEFLAELDSADYTTLWHRIQDLDIETPEREGGMVVQWTLLESR